MRCDGENLSPWVQSLCDSVCSRGREFNDGSREAAEECSHAQAMGRQPESPPAPEGRKRMSHTSGNILLHFILSTQGRRPLIKPEFRDDLFAYLGGIVREMNGTALIVNGVVDHVHMLIRVRPVHSAAGMARVMKANSSRWMRERHYAGFEWQTGYGVFSDSESNVAAVTQY